jgi:transcriptional regulator with XRE-family HTH domain
MGMRNLGAYIRERRLERGLTQEEIGDAVGVSHSSVSKWERGRQEGMDFVTLRNLAAVLGDDAETLEALLRDEPRPAAPAPQPEPSREIPAYDIGTVAAGPRGRAEVHHWESVPLSQTRGRMLRAAIVSGDCMGDEVRPGDTVLFDRNPNPRDGQLVVAVLLDEGPDETGQGVLKRFFKLNGKVKLAPNVGDPIIVAADRVRIEGVVVEVRRRYAA